MSILDEIISIEEDGIEDTIDIELMENSKRLFFANGILTHNSGYNTSDVDMGNTGESVGLNQSCDFLGVFWQLPGDREACRLNMKFLKDRYGGNGSDKSIPFNVDYNTLRISDPGFGDDTKNPVQRNTEMAVDILVEK